MALPKRLRFALAQLGPKPNGGASLSLLIDSDQLPGDAWSILDERTWRAGSIGKSTPWGDRARAAQAVVGWRSFVQGDNRWIWIEVLPYTSSEDARSALQALSYPGSFMKNLRAKSEVTSERILRDFEIPGSDASFAIELDADGLRAHSVCKIAAGIVDRTVFIATFTSWEPWPWPEVISVAAAQARRMAQA